LVCARHPGLVPMAAAGFFEKYFGLDRGRRLRARVDARITLLPLWILDPESAASHYCCGLSFAAYLAISRSAFRSSRTPSRRRRRAWRRSDRDCAVAVLETAFPDSLRRFLGYTAIWIGLSAREFAAVSGRARGPVFILEGYRSLGTPSRRGSGRLPCCGSQPVAGKGCCAASLP